MTEEDAVGVYKDRIYCAREDLPCPGIPLANASLVLGVVTCAGKLSLVIEYAEEAVDSVTMKKVKDKAVEYLLDVKKEKGI